jgi:hypothetical protein
MKIVSHLRKRVVSGCWAATVCLWPPAPQLERSLRNAEYIYAVFAEIQSWRLKRNEPAPLPWTPQSAMFMWRNTLVYVTPGTVAVWLGSAQNLLLMYILCCSSLGNINRIADPATHGLAIDCLLEMFGILDETWQNQV